MSAFLSIILVAPSLSISAAALPPTNMEGLPLVFTATKDVNGTSSVGSTWYFGKEIKPNSYLMYKVDDDSGYSPTGAFQFYLAIYFDRFDNKTNSWTGKVFATKDNDVSVNNFTYFLNRGASGTVFSHNVPYTGCVGEGCLTSYQLFLDSAARAYDQIFGPFLQYASYPGRKLTDSKWASTVYSPASASLNGTKIVTVDAGTFNCTELADSAGNVALINKDLPFPVIGSYFRGLSGSSDSPVIHRYYLNYRLVAMGENIPSLPEFGIVYPVLAISFVSIVALFKFSHSKVKRLSTK